jgi:hypothetical protein
MVDNEEALVENMGFGGYLFVPLFSENKQIPLPPQDGRWE